MLNFDFDVMPNSSQTYPENFVEIETFST